MVWGLASLTASRRICFLLGPFLGRVSPLAFVFLSNLTSFAEGNGQFARRNSARFPRKVETSLAMLSICLTFATCSCDRISLAFRPHSQSACRFASQAQQKRAPCLAACSCFDRCPFVQTGFSLSRSVWSVDQSSQPEAFWCLHLVFPLWVGAYVVRCPGRACMERSTKVLAPPHLVHTTWPPCPWKATAPCQTIRRPVAVFRTTRAARPNPSCKGKGECEPPRPVAPNGKRPRG